MQVIYKRKKKLLRERAEGVVNESQKETKRYGATRRYTESRVSPVDGYRRRTIGELFEGLRKGQQGLRSGCGD